MANFKFSLNEGSLLRRTVLHVGAFVLGTAAFLALSSFLLMTLLKGILPSEKGASGSGDDSSEEAASAASSSSPRAAGKPLSSRKKRPGPAAAAAAEEE